MASEVAAATGNIAAFGFSASTTKQRRQFPWHFALRPVAKRAIGLGILSSALYFLLYFYSNDINDFAELTKQGDKAYFMAPVIIALVFSLVHGYFTDLFWEAAGLRAKR